MNSSVNNTVVVVVVKDAVGENPQAEAPVDAPLWQLTTCLLKFETAKREKVSD